MFDIQYDHVDADVVIDRQMLFCFLYGMFLIPWAMAMTLLFSDGSYNFEGNGDNEEYDVGVALLFNYFDSSLIQTIQNSIASLYRASLGFVRHFYV